jgi:hypothetical protein
MCSLTHGARFRENYCAGAISKRLNPIIVLFELVACCVLSRIFRLAKAQDLLSPGVPKNIGFNGLNA